MAGGTVIDDGKDPRCSDTFSATENCWFDDRCRNVVHFYGEHENCCSTYKSSEWCTVNDKCSLLIKDY